MSYINHTLVILICATFVQNSNYNLVLGCITSTSDLQPSTAIVNQLPGQLVSTHIRTRGPNCFKFIIASIMLSINVV